MHACACVYVRMCVCACVCPCTCVLVVPVPYVLITCVDILYKDQVIAVVQCVSFLGAVRTKEKPKATLMESLAYYPLEQKKGYLGCSNKGGKQAAEKLIEWRLFSRVRRTKNTETVSS